MKLLTNLSGSKRSREDDPSTENAQNSNRRRSDQDADISESQCPVPEASNEVSHFEVDTSVSIEETRDRSSTADDGEENMRRISDLSFILHPAHETSTPNMERGSNAQPLSADTQRSAAIGEACSTLNLSHAALEHLVSTYFENMVAINLFHEPSFYEKLSTISSSIQICALLTAMRSFAVRFDLEKSDSGNQADTHQSAACYLDLAANYINEALKECGDDTPPICILQACIVSAHCQLTQGVLGKAWRSLGTCIRLAYEMNLHLVDVGVPQDITEVDPKRWCEDEEKRRAWWAIWEMDVFATTIRRTPTAVDWSQIDTLLPVADSYWFQCKPHSSCFLEMDPIHRWKALQRSGNESPKAWFIVINSLMKDAQRISNPRGVPSVSRLSGTQPTSSIDSRNSCRWDRPIAARQRLEVITNAVQCFRLALPKHLKYNNQYLGFDARIPGQYTSLRQEHSSIYNIYMMTQLARLMIHRYDAFGQFRPASPSRDQDTTDDPERANASGRKDWTESLAIKQFFEAADDLLAIVRRSCDDHVRHINPFLSSTIWLASAVLLVRSRLCRLESMRSVIKSRYEVMHLTYRKCVDFWDMHTTVQQNLETLEQRLEACPRPDGREQSQPRNNSGRKGSRRQSQRSYQQSSGSHVNSSEYTYTCSWHKLPWLMDHSEIIDSSGVRLPHPNNMAPGNQFSQLPLSPPSSQVFQPTNCLPNRQADDIPAGRSPGASTLDFMHFPSLQTDSRLVASKFGPNSPGVMVDPFLLGQAAQFNGPSPQNTDALMGIDVDPNGTCLRLPSDLQEMMSVFFPA
ncbi:hypothetical protein PHISCL_07592 [Aspergillus sclerotialis]|uniref:Xylanolytic transcriptional activator regulatory domain-containing protein n=1 Tax=Aspergillus sclerotialis TaxID=2070753 RepID=A0A3A2ZCQ5_9EURO|nr:hypothetical protein PHISCL_07592 [Aspergillus sclerotialis]